MEAACIHPVLSGNAVQRIEESELDRLVTTDSLPLPPEKRIDKARRALEEFQRVLELYPNSGRASAALYQRGMIHVELGNTGEARSAFEQVLRGYPDSPEAELAEEQLNQLGGG